MSRDNFLQFQSDNDEQSRLAKFTNLERLSEVKDRRANKDGFVSGPCIFLYDMIMLPQSLAPLFLENDNSSLKIILDAYEKNKTIFACFFIDAKAKVSEKEPLDVGMELAVANLMEQDSNHYSVLLQARRRITHVEQIVNEDAPWIRGKIARDNNRNTQKLSALMRTTVRAYKKYATMVEFLNDDVCALVENCPKPGELADMIASTVDLSYENRLSILLETDVEERLTKVLRMLKVESRLLRLEGKIQNQVQSELDKSQREVYLREQIAALQLELNDGKNTDPEIQKITEALEKKELPAETRDQVLKELERIKLAPPLSPENGMIMTYLNWINDLPWSEETEDNLDVRHAQMILECNHHGLRKAKDRILEYIAVQSLHPERSKQPILCFVGPPGTGKTSLGKSIATSIGRNFVRVSLGGVHDEAEIRGHRRTYIGAMPGRIIQTLRKSKVINPLFMLDEIDKLSSDFQGDPSAALLEVLDPEQNSSFSDHYLEVPYNLSKVLFITTANSINNIPPALLDRMELIDFPGYVEEEKIMIANQFLIPKQSEENGFINEPITFQPEALRAIIQGYTYEAGVRNLEREIAAVFRKLARAKSEGIAYPDQITADIAQQYLGPVEFFTNLAEGSDETGVATALAWTENGGEIMPVEVLVIEGKGNLQVTGQIGDVMQESAQAALSYLKSKTEIFQLPTDYFENVDVHIHIPEGSIPKDGPSAGITLATALTSAVLGIPVHHEVAMTGEITLRGRVLPVGGIREKVLAANRSGINTLLIPRKNEKDLIEIPDSVKAHLQIVLVENMDEVLASSLTARPINTKKTRIKTSEKKKKDTTDVSAVLDKPRKE